MIKKIDQYIIRRFFKYFFINLLIITGILWFTKIVKFLELATVKNISFIDFIILSLLILFNLVSFLIPLIILIAVIFTLYSFYNSKELFVFKSAGLSRVQIIKPFIWGFSLIILFNYLLLFYLSPLSERKMTSLKTKLANQFLISVIEEETFNNIDEDTTIFIDKKDNSGVFKNVVIYSKDQDNNDLILSAKEAKLIKYKKKIILGLNQGRRSIIDEKHVVKDSLLFQKYLTDLDFFNEEKEIFEPKKKISEYYITDLFNKKNINENNVNKITIERQHRILWPWLGIVLGMVAITLLLRGEYDRKGNIKKNINVIIIALAFMICYFLIKNWTSQRVDLAFINYIFVIFSLISLSALNLVKRISA